MLCSVTLDEMDELPAGVPAGSFYICYGYMLEY